MNLQGKRLLFFALALFLCKGSLAQNIGATDTTFRALGKNDQISVDAFDDPKVSGVTCYLSRAVTGGIEGSLNVAEDPSDTSIHCIKTGPIRFKAKISGSKGGEPVFSVSQSLVFKQLKVIRFVDRRRHVLVYLANSKRVITGYPTHSVSVVNLRE